MSEGRLILVTGGSRSGKSDYAQRRAEALAGPRCFIATCPPAADDDEMAARITAHRRKRRDRGWRTIEEGLEVAARLADLPPGATVLIDCLTLWVSNLMAAGPDLDEGAVSRRGEALIAAGRALGGTVLMVTNEVGCGTVPEHPLARRFRDLCGRLNQVVAGGADEVVLVSCGLPLILKGGNE